jgi:hypothetical protein
MVLYSLRQNLSFKIFQQFSFKEIQQCHVEFIMLTKVYVISSIQSKKKYTDTGTLVLVKLRSFSVCVDFVNLNLLLAESTCL